MVKMSKESMEFLKKYVPIGLYTDNPEEVINYIYDYIEEEEYQPPDYDDYTEVGKAGERAVMDIYEQNKEEVDRIQLSPWPDDPPEGDKE